MVKPLPNMHIVRRADPAYNDGGRSTYSIIDDYCTLDNSIISTSKMRELRSIKYKSSSAGQTLKA